MRTSNRVSHKALQRAECHHQRNWGEGVTNTTEKGGSVRLHHGKSALQRRKDNGKRQRPQERHCWYVFWSKRSWQSGLCMLLVQKSSRVSEREKHQGRPRFHQFNLPRATCFCSLETVVWNGYWNWFCLSNFQMAERDHRQGQYGSCALHYCSVFRRYTSSKTEIHLWWKKQ